MAYNPSDLDLIERALLGVLCVGLPPSRAAGSDTFRVDHVTAVVIGLAEGERERHLGPDGVKVTPEFRAKLGSTVEGLVDKGIVTQQAAGMPAAAGGFAPGIAIDMVDPDEHPVLLDRYLGQLCMEEFFNIKAVYPFLMERYSKSGEIWRGLREKGYGD